MLFRSLDRALQRRRRVTTPQPHARQLPRGRGEPVQDRERILVVVEMTDPQDRRIAVYAGRHARHVSIARREMAGGLGNLEYFRARSDEAVALKRFCLRARVESNASAAAAPTFHWRLRQMRGSGSA